jgi:predicted DCC family thiol-disulfide oxidoreductase YuxK
LDARLILIFDGYCGICTRMVLWVRAQDRQGRILALPSQLPDLLDRYGLTPEQVAKEVWAFDAAGNAWSGAEAIFRTLEEFGAPWSGIAAWSRRPPFKQLAGPSYAWFARNRHLFARWGAPPECADPARGCLPP